jgi:predicted nucleotidyltransferase
LLLKKAQKQSALAKAGVQMGSDDVTVTFLFQRKHSRHEIQLVARRLSETLSEPAAIVLVGSCARNCATNRSDVDILVVGEKQPAFKLRAPDVEFHRFSATSFLSKFQNGDDFPSWCTRFGIPLAGNVYWESIVREAQPAKWPDWTRKIAVAARRLLATRLSLMTDDREAAAESAIFAYDHLIRGILLKEGIFPLSRPELVDQVQPLFPELGKSLFTLLHDSIRTLDFPQLLHPLMTALGEIDPEMRDHSDYSLRKILSRVPA